MDSPDTYQIIHYDPYSYNASSGGVEIYNSDINTNASDLTSVR